MLSRFRTRGRQAEKIDLGAVERELEGQVDALLLTRLRFTLLTWSVGVVAVLIAEVTAIAFIADWLARSSSGHSQVRVAEVTQCHPMLRNGTATRRQWSFLVRVRY